MGIGDWRRLIETYLRPHRRLVALLATTLFVTIGLQVTTPQLVRVFIDRATDPTAASGSLTAITAVYVTAVLLQQMFRIATAYLSEVVGWLSTNELRADLLEHCLALDPAFHETHSPGELIERVDGDLNGLSVFFAEFLLNVLGSALLLVAVLVVVWFQDPIAGGVLSGFAVVALVALVAVRRISAGAWQQAREDSALLFGYLEERLAGTQDIRSCAAENHTLRGFYDRARNRLWSTSRARVRDATPQAVNNVIAGLANAVAFVVPALLVRRSELTVGSAFVLYFYTQLLMQPLTNVSRQVEQLQQAIAGGRRVLELLGIDSRIVDGTGPDLPPSGAPLAVAYRGVRFGYGEDPDVLHDVDLHVEPGHVLGIVGRTGSGKSSLARLLVRFHDVRAGGVEVGGIDVRTLARHQLRDRVALVTQEVHVLRATVRDNLTLFDPARADADILRAIDRLGLGPWFAKLADGLDTIVREGGAGMSAGEAQLLSFGRAFLADPAVVVLDEASSRLDPATEALLEHAVDALLEGRTGILIAHRLSTLERCDTICVLEHGRVVEHGARRDLAADPASRFGALLRTGLDVVPG
ncbi:MAG TPA: ABC transporter ATP-binding protein [Acidimicrobiales bacterium]|nr:ABC transporter ATP-binding protein [Acidimicrobiales bacterium]